MTNKAGYCSYCGQRINAARVIERIINNCSRPQVVSQIQYKCLATLTDKEVVNALAYLVRRRKVVRLAYGQYRRLP